MDGLGEGVKKTAPREKGPQGSTRTARMRAYGRAAHAGEPAARTARPPVHPDREGPGGRRTVRKGTERRSPGQPAARDGNRAARVPSALTCQTSPAVCVPTMHSSRQGASMALPYTAAATRDTVAHSTVRPAPGQAARRTGRRPTSRPATAPRPAAPRPAAATPSRISSAECVVNDRRSDAGVGGAREERRPGDVRHVPGDRVVQQFRGVPALRQPRPDEHAALRAVPGAAGGQRGGQSVQQRVAAHHPVGVPDPGQVRVQVVVRQVAGGRRLVDGRAVQIERLLDDDAGAARSGGRARSQPSRSPGASTLEKLPSRTVRSAACGSAATHGSDAPSNRSSPYGSSSTIHIPYRAAISATARRRSSGRVRPVGFWKVGIR